MAPTNAHTTTSRTAVVLEKMVRSWPNTLAIVTMVFELGFLPAVVLCEGRQSLLRWVPVAFALFSVVFHVSIWTVLNIDFRPLGWCVVVAVLVDWDAMVAHYYCDMGWPLSSPSLHVRDYVAAMANNVGFSVVFVALCAGQTYMGVCRKEIGFPCCCYPTFAPWSRSKYKSTKEE